MEPVSIAIHNMLVLEKHRFDLAEKKKRDKANDKFTYLGSPSPSDYKYIEDVLCKCGGRVYNSYCKFKGGSVPMCNIVFCENCAAVSIYLTEGN